MRKVSQSSLVQRILHASSPQACCSPRLQTPSIFVHQRRADLCRCSCFVKWEGSAIYLLLVFYKLEKREHFYICLYFVEWKLVVQFLYRAIELMFLGIMVGSWPLFAVCWNIILISMNRLMFLNRFLTPCMNRWFSSGYESTHGLPSQPMSQFSKATRDALNIWHTLV